MPIILSQNQNQQNDEIIKNIKDEIKKQQKESDKINRRYRKLMKSRESVKQMVQEYEDNIITPPPEFRDEIKFENNIIPPPLEFQGEIQISKLDKAILKGRCQIL